MTDKPTIPQPICIEQVENGYLLSNSVDTEGRYPHRRTDTAYEVKRPHVFQSMTELIGYLETYFTHRNEEPLRWDIAIDKQ